MSADVDVCIIGAGLAGIAAALEARKAGASVLVVESSEAAGGKAQTHDSLERGPQSFNGRYEVFWQLLEQLNLAAEAVPLRATTRYLARNEALHALKPSPLTLLGTKALTFSEKLALARDALTRRPLGAAQSVHDFFAARFGSSFADGPAAAMISGIFAGDPRALSIDACFPDLAERARSEQSIVKAMLKTPKTGRRGLFTLRGGMGRVGEAARAALPIELGCPVRELVRDASGFWVHSRRMIHARALVVATDAPSAAKLLWPVSQKLGAALGQLKYVPLSVVHWEGPEARFGDGFGYLACPSENLFALGTMFHERRRYSTFVRGIDDDDARLEAGIASDVKKLTGGSLGRVLRVDRWPHAVFQPTLEMLPTRSGLAALATEAGVSLAGSYLGASAMKDALASGFRAGLEACQTLQRTASWSRSLS